MFILIPIILLLLFAVLINLLGRYRLSIGSTWLIAAGSVLLVWILLIVFRVKMPAGLTIDNWSPIGIGSDLLVFKLSTKTWIFAFLLVSLLVGVIFTDTIRLGQGNNLTTWTGSMVLTAVGLLSIYSQTLLAVVITWSIIDIVEFGLLIRVTNHPRVHNATILEFSSRVIGTVLIIGALIFSGFHTVIVENTQYSSAVFILVLLGAALRLGVLPLHVPLTANLPIRRSLGTILRYVAPVTVISFLSQVQPQLQHSTISRLLFPLALITAFYGAVKWLIAKNELIGRPYWMLAFSGLVVISFLDGQTEGVIALSLMMVICGGFIFFHSYSTKFSRVLGIICFLGLVGFPFTPTSPVWVSLIGANQLEKGLLIFTISLLFLGLLKHLFHKNEQNPDKEMWMKLFYSIGLGLLMVVPWIIMVWRFRETLGLGKWGASIVCLVFIGLLFILQQSKVGQKISLHPVVQRFQKPITVIGKIISDFFTFEWFSDFLLTLYDVLGRPIKFFTNILEGDGGLLWSLLFLALISSVLVGRIVP